VVFASNAEGPFDLWRLALRDNRPAGELVRLTEQSGTSTSPAVSPDGQWLAFLRVTDGQRDVWTMPAGGGLAMNFTDHPSIETCPEWSPDGGRLAFVSDRSGVDQVWVSSVRDGKRVGEPRRVAGVDGAVTSPSWSPDGARIGLVETAGSESDVWTISVDGSEPARKLTQGANAWFLVWSRSSGDLLVLGLWGSPQLSIRAVAGGGGRPRELPAAAPSEGSASLTGGFDVSLDGKLLALSESSMQGDVWVLEAKQGSF
jgi:TolB protein